MRISDCSSDVCSSDLRRLLHARDRVDAELDLLRIDVEAAGDDEVLGPPDDMDVAALVDRRHVSGDEEAVLAVLGGGLLRLASVAADDGGALHLQHPHRALRAGPAILLDARKLTHGAG